MDGFDINIDEGFYLNYEEISKSKEMMAVTRLLATDLMRDSYIKVGDFISHLTNEDLNNLIAKIDEPEDESEIDYQDLILIAEMLATGEGCHNAQDEDTIIQRMEQLVLFLTCESLYRKGMVKVFHENFSFHEDMLDKPIVEKLDE